MKKIGFFALLFVTWLAGYPVQAVTIVPTGGQSGAPAALYSDRHGIFTA